MVVLEFVVHFAYTEYQDERREHYRSRSGKGPEDAQEFRRPRLFQYAVADVCGTVYSDRPRGHLRNGYYVGKSLFIDPPVYGHYLRLDQRQHRIASSDSEETYDEKSGEQLDEYHFVSSLLRLSLYLAREYETIMVTISIYIGDTFRNATRSIVAMDIPHIHQVLFDLRAI